MLVRKYAPKTIYKVGEIIVHTCSVYFLCSLSFSLRGVFLCCHCNDLLMINVT